MLQTPDLRSLQHLYAMEQVRVAMSFFEFLKLPLVFTDDDWIVDMRHGLIVPLITRIRIRAFSNLAGVLARALEAQSENVSWARWRVR